MDDIVEIMARRMYPATFELPRINLHKPLYDKAMAKSRAAVAALRDAGYEIVPVEPTEAMMREGADWLPVTPGGATNKCAGRVYEAMLTAAKGDGDD